jgi:hypothetical protein
MHYFEDGELKIHNEKQSRIIAGQFLDLRPFFEGFNKRAFVSAMIGIFQHENYSHDEFINKLKMRGAPRLDFCQNAEQYKLLVEDIFNFKRRTKVNLRY